MNVQCALLTLGNGDNETGERVLSALVARMAAARKKHPRFACGEHHALGEIEDEMREFSYAVLHESPQRQQDEALDVAVTALRFIAGEHLQGERHV